MAPLDFRFATFNTWDYAAPALKGRKKALSKAVRAAKADFYALTECDSDTRDYLRSVLPGGPKRWLVWPRGTQAVMFDSARWQHHGRYDLIFGPTAYHGAIMVPFTEKASGFPVTVGAYHLPPDSVTGHAYQQSQFRRFLRNMAVQPGTHLIGGDGVNDSSWAVGWTDARIAAMSTRNRNAPTYKGKAITDRIFSDNRTPVLWRGYNVNEVGNASDHDLVITAGTVGITPTN